MTTCNERSKHIWQVIRLGLGGVLVAFAFTPPASAQDSPSQGPPSPGAPAATAAPLTEAKVIERVTQSIDRAVEYLAAHQRPDGSWDDSNAPTALALLAIMGRGHTPNRGPYREVVERGKKYLLRRQNDEGVFVSKRQAGPGPMYEHSLCTLACAEMYGMDGDPELEDRLRRAVDVIIASQAPSGGWRYHPNPSDQDLSVTVMQIVALRAANNAEIPVPQETINKAVEYVRTCADPQGGFGYQGPSRNPHMAAAGVVSLQLLGHYDDSTVTPALEYFTNRPVEWKRNDLQYFYYFHYYAIQATYQAGGKWWDDWHPKVREMFLENQNPNGSWDVPEGTSEQPNVVGINNIYWTSMAALVLEVYLHYLPAYQR
jgi:hypothetical protein